MSSTRPQCPECNGRGANTVSACGGSDRVKSCWYCKGKGTVTYYEVEFWARARALYDTRVDAKLSLREVANRLGVAPKLLSDWEHAREPIPESFEEQYAEILRQETAR